MASPRLRNRDRNLVLGLFAAVFALILILSVFTPASEDTDPVPSTYNTGAAGAKAAFLLLSDLGFSTTRWLQPTSALATLDAPHTTLILADPIFPAQDARQVQDDLQAFLNRGGRVLATGPAGAYFLPGAQTSPSSRLYTKLCYTSPEGLGPLARAGQLSLPGETRWTAPGPLFRVAQRCGPDAVVVSFHFGLGEAIWWASPMPLSNLGLRQDASLRLLLAAVSAPGEAPGPSRQVLFDEYFHGQRASLSDNARGLPLAQLGWQAALVALLLVLSFGRRNGPLRAPARLPRSSPVEFAESMGRLYSRAGATHAATSVARRRLLTFLAESCGLSRETLRSSPDIIVEALHHRLGGDWSRLGQHLTQSLQAEDAAASTLAPRAALALVKALDRDQQALAARILQHPTSTTTQPSREESTPR